MTIDDDYGRINIKDYSLVRLFEDVPEPTQRAMRSYVALDAQKAP